MPSVELSCPVYPSEDSEKVKAAILKVFPGVELELSQDFLRGKTESLNFFGHQIRKQKILDSARNVLLRGMRGNRTVFHLNKQVAFMGLISFCEERTILGTIKVTIIDDELEALIDDLAPETVDGEEVLI